MKCTFCAAVPFRKGITFGSMNWFLRYKVDHVIFWFLTIGFHGFTTTVTLKHIDFSGQVLEVIIRNGLLAILIYLNLLLIFPRLIERNKMLMILLSLLSLCVYTVVKSAHDLTLLPLLIPDLPEADFFLVKLFYNFAIALFYFAIAAALQLSRQWLIQRELLRQIKLEKLSTELEYLKAQMNPHFLFNSINTIFFQIDKQNHSARETLGKFSDMLRYQLYECNGTEIAIEKELAYLKNYVELQKLRRNEHDILEFTVADALRNFTLPPLLLIPFIENAFKHISNFTDKKNEVRIELTKNGQQVQLMVFNTTDSSDKETGGIGLKNVKRRLELLFPHRHTLDMKKTTDRFEITLALELV